MSFKSLEFGLILAAATAVAGIGPVSAEEQASTTQRRASAPAQTQDGYRTATRLGGSRALMGVIRNRAALKRLSASPMQQKRLSGVMDKAGLTALTPQVLRAMTDADPGVVRETRFEIGRTIDWMGLRDKGRPDIIRNIRWGGRRPFEAFEFSIEDGYRTYNFVVPKDCGNLSLANIVEKPLPECVNIDVKRDCDSDTKTMTITASGSSISSNQITRVEVTRGMEKFGDLLPAQRFTYSGPVQGGRYSMKAFDTYGREVPICNPRDILVENCPPPIVLPPRPVSCALTASATQVKRDWTIAVDGSGSFEGASPARELVVEVLDPTGNAVSFEHEGRTTSSAALSAPFRATFLLRRPAAGTYTVRALAKAENPKVHDGSCQATVTIIPPADKVSFFVGGYVGKERRQREVELANGVVVTPGFCAPLVGVKGGVGFKVADNFQVAPAIGVAINTDEGKQSSLFGDLELNYLFDKGGYLGTGIGVWDFNHGDTVTGSWLLHFGVPVYTTANGNKLFFAAEWRLLFDGIDKADSNYQFWGGLRYEWRKR